MKYCSTFDLFFNLLKIKKKSFLAHKPLKTNAKLNLTHEPYFANILGDVNSTRWKELESLCAR